MRLTLMFAALAVLTACSAGDNAPSPRATFGLGRTPSAAELAALDIDIDTTGRGLPDGHGTAAEGAVVYAQQCASCHGAKGEGINPAPALITRPGEPADTTPRGRAPRTIGNYWPYATTIFDYVRRAMPINAPGSLSAEATYSVVAYLLNENGIIAAADTMSARTLPAVAMPARHLFVPDNRSGGSAFR